jgi:hypothetical protein
LADKVSRPHRTKRSKLGEYSVAPHIFSPHVLTGQTGQVTAMSVPKIINSCPAPFHGRERDGGREGGERNCTATLWNLLI